MMWWTLSGMALITYLNRYAFFADFVRYSPGPKIRRLLSYSSYAVLTAIWAPLVFSFEFGQGFQHAGADYIFATILAAVMAILRLPSIVVVLISSAVFFGMRFYL